LPFLFLFLVFDLLFHVEIAVDGFEALVLFLFVFVSAELGWWGGLDPDIGLSVRFGSLVSFELGVAI